MAINRRQQKQQAQKSISQSENLNQLVIKNKVDVSSLREYYEEFLKKQ